MVNKKIQKGIDEVHLVNDLFTVAQGCRVMKSIKDELSRKNINSKDITLIDAGCHDGRFSKFLDGNWLYPKYIGLEIREDYVESGNKKFGNNRISLEVCDLTDRFDIDKYKEKADVVICLEVLEHVSKIEAYVIVFNLITMLKSGGLLIIGTPVNYKDKVFHTVEKEKLLGHVNFLVHEELVNFFEKANLEIIEASGGVSMRSSYVIPRKLDPVWELIKEKLGIAFRSIYLACSNKNGGGYYVCRKK